MQQKESFSTNKTYEQILQVSETIWKNIKGKMQILTNPYADEYFYFLFLNATRFTCAACVNCVREPRQIQTV